MFFAKSKFDIAAHLKAIAAAQATQLRQLAAIEGKLTAMAHSIDETLAAVADEDSKTDSLIALMNGVEQQLKDALAGTTVPPAVQAKIDAVFDSITNNATKVQSAIDAAPGGQPPASGGGAPPAPGTPS